MTRTPSIDNDQTMIFHDILQSGLSPSELAPTRLEGEALSVVAAGTTTTTHYLTLTMYHLLANADILTTLGDERR